MNSVLVQTLRSAVEKERRLRARHADGGSVRMTAAEPRSDRVPTLKSGVYRTMSPMLGQRFELFGRWETATHGDWLSLSDMERLWDGTIDDDRLSAIRSNRDAAEKGWPNEPSALFRPERLSLFAGHTDMTEKIYLVWLDFEPEPELWVNDSNGESRYRDLGQYLDAYLADDLSASQRSWRA